MTEHQQLTIEILIASTIQGLSLEAQRDMLMTTILVLVDKQDERQLFRGTPLPCPANVI